MSRLAVPLLWFTLGALLIAGAFAIQHAIAAPVEATQRATLTPIPRQMTPTPKCDTSGLALGMDVEEQALWALINDYRQANGRSRLVWTPSLEKAALWMANDLGYVPGSGLSHNDRTGRGPFGRMPDCGYVASAIMGENIASGYTTASGVFNGWKGSPGHNYVMLHDQFRVGGLARAYRASSYWGWYWVLDVGGASESSGGMNVHPESRWQWVCPNSVCERVR